jgi:hypothetical protein
MLGKEFKISLTGRYIFSKSYTYCVMSRTLCENLRLVCTVNGFSFLGCKYDIKAKYVHRYKMIPPIIKEALHEETAEFFIFRTFCPLIIT